MIDLKLMIVSDPFHVKQSRYVSGHAVFTKQPSTACPHTLMLLVVPFSDRASLCSMNTILTYIHPQFEAFQALWHIARHAGMGVNGRAAADPAVHCKGMF
jgi:hypothetical protein